MNVTKIYDRSVEVLVAQVADRTANTIIHAWTNNRDAHVVLTGGRLSVKICKELDLSLYRLLVRDKKSEKSEALGQLHIWFSDERYVAFDNPNRTDTQLIANFSKVGGRVIFHRFATPSELPLSEAIDEYTEQLMSAIGDNRFDVSILSLGEDGHLASCFPGSSELLRTQAPVIAILNSPKPPAERISLSLARLAKSQQIYLLATGEGKRQALENSLDEFSDSLKFPFRILREADRKVQIFIMTDLN